MSGPPLREHTLDVRVGHGTTTKRLNSAAVSWYLDYTANTMVVLINSKELLAAMEFLEQPEVSSAPSLDAVVRSWVK